MKDAITGGVGGVGALEHPLQQDSASGTQCGPAGGGSSQLEVEYPLDRRGSLAILSGCFFCLSYVCTRRREFMPDACGDYGIYLGLRARAGVQP
jgi:hypothetical protein